MELEGPLLYITVTCYFHTLRESSLNLFSLQLNSKMPTLNFFFSKMKILWKGRGSVGIVRDPTPQSQFFQNDFSSCPHTVVHLSTFSY